MATLSDGRIRPVATRGLALGLLLFCSCRPFEIATVVNCFERDHHPKLEAGTKPTVEALAHDVDLLERYIDKYGSVVTKQPDVWGQARLTRHRQEFESQLAAQLDTFGFTLQGTVSESDQAYFADAMALSAAAGGNNPPASGGSGSSSSSSSSSGGQTAQQQSGTSQSSQPPSPSATALPADFSNVFGAVSNISRTAPQNGISLEYAGASQGISIEPTVLLDQRARFLNHLHELRRINEGDDTADSPGYALNLVRIPVSILPGKLTEIGRGAEVTITIKPCLSDNLLDLTFPNLVLNDLMDELGFPVTQFINDPDNKPYFTWVGARDVDDLLTYLGQRSQHDLAQDVFASGSTLAGFRLRPGIEMLLSRPEWAWVDPRNSQQSDFTAEIQRYVDQLNTSAIADLQLKGPDQESFRSYVQGKKPEAARSSDPQTLRMLVAALDIQKKTTQIEPALRGEQLRKDLPRIAKISHVYIPIPATKSRRARLPFPASEIFDVSGFDFDRIVVSAYRRLGKQPYTHAWAGRDDVYIHLPDVQGYLQEQILAAYDFLRQPPNQDLWSRFCRPELVVAVRTGGTDFLESERLQFKYWIRCKGASESFTTSTTVALAWAIIVDSALLNQRLIEDIQESAALRGCRIPVPPGTWLPYYLPYPPPVARASFNAYVACRWPIHVFALDPAAQQQNLADRFSGRREMQLALSMAFVGGKLSANNMMRYARRIEYDFNTIDLNGTEIGFSHGDDTFGWRFYPRFQTPDIESNATVFFRDMLIGGPNRNDLLNERRLEPGIRECYAIVIMPSFVPYATMSFSSNWFKLTDPKCKELDAQEAMRMSSLVNCIETFGPRVVDGGCYRGGDVWRLLEKVKQLETRLPLQSAMVQIPYENTLGGFAMFNTGVTDLAPELTGWYGASSINPKQPTTLFLVGNHFSVLQTEVIAGGQPLSNPELLSRQVMKVVIPAGPIVLTRQKEQFVDVQLATPYGVTQHLLIPVSTPPADGSPPGAVNGVAWKPPGQLDLAFSYGAVGITQPDTTVNPRLRPPQLLIQKGDVKTNIYDVVDVTLKFPAPFDSTSVTLPAIPYNAAQDAYVVTGDQVAAAVFATVGASFGPETTNPPAQLALKTSLVFRSSRNAALPLQVKSLNDLNVTWIKVDKSSPKQ
jgi:hypothetical protein